MNWPTSIFLAATLFSISLSARAQDNSPTVPADTLTNAPTLKELMSSNNIVTNTVGVVLVKISRNFWAGKYEVTQDAYEKVMHSNPSEFSGGANPVDSVSWNDAMSFCSKLTDMETRLKQLPKGWRYTLPTEDQWKMLNDNTPITDGVMKINGPSSSTAPVGSLKPNSLGLYDTLGNVMEWVLDSHDSNFRVLKGGAWDTFVKINVRPEFQWRVAPDDKKNSYGFRVVLSGG